MKNSYMIITCVEATKWVEAPCSFEDNQIVKEGGWLLHRIRRNNDTTYWEVAEQYECFWISMDCVVLFLLNIKGPSTKDHEHLGRSAKISAAITVTGELKWDRYQEAFFTNIKNKTHSIELLV